MSRDKLLAKITEKWPAKALSLAAAIIISVFYRTSTLETRVFSAPLRVETNNLLIPVNSFADTVSVSIRAEGDSVRTLAEDDIEVYIDLKRYAAEGAHKVPVQFRKRGGALAVEPLEISVTPIEIPLVLEQRVSRDIPVFPVFRGAIAQGYELTSQSAAPVSVAAEGPRGSIDSHTGFFTGTIDLEGRYEDFTILVNIINDNPLVTIHGNMMLEYSGTIRRIARGPQTPDPRTPGAQTTDLQTPGAQTTDLQTPDAPPETEDEAAEQ